MNLKRIIIITFSCFIAHSCTNSLSSEDYLKQCPYEFKYGLSHYLEVPIDIVPHQQYYNVGESITISFDFPNEIFDLTRNVSFTIDDFPFRPIIFMYKFTDVNNWESGFELQDIVIDSSHFIDFNINSNNTPNTLLGKTTFSDSVYKFNAEIVLQEKGTYILVVADQYMENVGGGNPEANNYANNIQFEGRCPETNFFICNIIKSGSLHVNEYQEYLKYLDREVYRNELSRIDDNDSLDYFGTGSLAMDWLGFFSFEVN